MPRLIGHRDRVQGGWRWSKLPDKSAQPRLFSWLRRGLSLAFQQKGMPHMPSAFPRVRARLVPLLASVAVLVALLAAAIPLALGGGGSAHANGSLVVDKRCGAQASVGQPVKYIIDITNTSGVETLTIDAVNDPLLGGDISSNFPASLAPGETASWIDFRGILESDLPGPVINTVTVDATGSSSGPLTAGDSCTTDSAAMTLTKTAEFVNGDTVFTFVITNVGSSTLQRFSVTDNVLGNLTSLFPRIIEVGESVTVVLTVPGEECDNTVFALYQGLPLSVRVDARAECGEGGGPDFTATKECFPKTGDVGDPINVKVDVFNIGTDPFTNVSATDDHAGALAFSGGDVNNNNLLDPGETWVFTGSYDFGAGTFTNQATVNATTLTNILLIRLTNTDTCVRTEPPNGGSQLTPTDTDCDEFRDDNAPDLDELMYDVRRGTLSNVVPGVFFYFTEVAISSTAGTADAVTIGQSNDSGGLFDEFKIKDAVIYSDPSCSPLPKNLQPNCKGLTDCTFEIGQTGDFIIRVRYDSKSIAGADVCPLPLESSEYTFSTVVNAVLTTSDDINLVPKANAHC